MQPNEAQSQAETPIQPDPGATVMPPTLGQAAAEAAEAAVPVEPAAQVDVSAADPAADDFGPEVAFTWEASEFVHHHKSASWYAALAGLVAALAIAAILLKLWLQIGLFVMMGIAVAVYARKPPRTMVYELSSDGVNVDGKAYPFEAFRSFAVIPDEEWHSIDLEPAKRLSPRLVLLFDTANFEEIVGHLERHLPREDRELDLIERITRAVRF